MATLYELSDEYIDIMQALVEAESDEEAEAAWKRLDAIECDISEKSERNAKMMRQLESDATAYGAEADRLTRLQRNAKQAAERLKQIQLDNMQRLDMPEIRTGIGRWKTQLNPWSCKVVDEALVPAEYRKPQPDKIDRKALTDNFRATGEIIPGCEFTQTIGIRFR